QVRGEQQDEPRVGVVGRRAVHAVPEGVACARARRADVGVAVVAVDAPGVEDALEVDELVAGPAEVVHDLALPSLHQRLPDALPDVVEHLVPRDALPAPSTARADAAQRIADALGIGHLVQRRRAFGAIASAAAGMRRVAFELLDREGLAVDVGEELAARFAVEADRRDQRVAPLDLLGPGDRVVLFPVVPALDGRIALEAALGGGELPGDWMKRRGCTLGHGRPSSAEPTARLSPTNPPTPTVPPA